LSSEDRIPVARVERIAEHEGERVRLRGWLQGSRSSGKILFLMLRDGTGTIQCVAGRGEIDAESFDRAAALGQESALEVTGTVRADRRAPSGFELQMEALRVVHETTDFPITPKEHGVAFLMERRHLWIRSRRPHAILRIRAEVERACHDYLESQGYLRLDPPILTPAACEGTTTLFETDYFGEKAYLTQSGQLYLEAGCQAFGKVYAFGPTFRAEKSKTRRHLMEFWMVEPEAAFLDLDADIALAEGMIAHVVQRVLTRCRTELALLERDPTPLERVRPPFPRISYAEAVQLLREKGSPIVAGQDFGGDEETLLSEAFDRPVVIHRYPTELKPFYMKRDPSDPGTVLNMDVLAPEGYGEIVGGSVREEDLDRLDARIRDGNLDPKPIEWYRDLRRYGSVPHAGFGMGVERVLAWLCGLGHVRETIPFPRLLGRLGP
jgi:asparaginyl-tRNA synthetase